MFLYVPSNFLVETKSFQWCVVTVLDTTVPKTIAFVILLFSCCSAAVRFNVSVTPSNVFPQKGVPGCAIVA